MPVSEVARDGYYPAKAGAPEAKSDRAPKRRGVTIKKFR
jgi:hypothetical protein